MSGHEEEREDLRDKANEKGKRDKDEDRKPKTEVREIERDK